MNDPTVFPGKLSGNGIPSPVVVGMAVLLVVLVSYFVTITLDRYQTSRINYVRGDGFGQQLTDPRQVRQATGALPTPSTLIPHRWPEGFWMILSLLCNDGTGMALTTLQSKQSRHRFH